MQFNKSKFNSGRFNTSESKTVVAITDFTGSSELFTIPARITFSKSILTGSSNVASEGYRTTQINLNISSYGDITSNSVKVVITDGYFHGEGELISNIIKELFASGAFDGTSNIIAILEVKGIITVRVKIDGIGSLISQSFVILNAKPSFSGRGDVFPLIKRETPLSVGILANGDLTSESIVIKFSKLFLDGEGRIQTKATKVIVSSADFYGYGDIEALLAKVFYAKPFFYGYGNIEATAQTEAILYAILNGSSEVTTTPYFIYKPPYIILPTKVLIEDTTTKVVII